MIKKSISVMSHALYPSLCHKLSHLLGSLPPSSVTYFMDGPQPALLDHHPVSPFLAPRFLLISCSSTEPYPSLPHVFGMTYHQKYTHHFFVSTTVIANHKTSSSSGASVRHPRAFHLKLKCHLFKLSYVP